MTLTLENLALRLEVNMTIPLVASDTTDYIQDISIDIRGVDISEKENSRDSILGRVSLHIIDVEKAEEDGVALEDLAEILDDIHADIGDMAFDVLLNCEKLEEVYGALPISRILLLQNLSVERRFRNLGIGSKVINALLTAFPQCDLIVLKPFGTELEKRRTDDSAKAANKKTIAYRKAEKRLRTFYERFGFRALTRRHMIFNPVFRRQPSLKSAREFRTRFFEDTSSGW